jgi:pyrimidine deaminase RibD-like protein
MRISDFHIVNHDKLDRLLVQLCASIMDGQRRDPNRHGMVAAAVLDPDNNSVSSTSLQPNGQWTHAERAAMDRYCAQFGSIPEGSIILTTLTPCSQAMHDRYGSSCEDLIDQSPVHKVYCGYQDPTQPYGHKKFHTEVTRNEKIQKLCKAFADTFLENDSNLGLGENFADGRNPQDRGDSARYGIPKHATLSTLDKIGQGSGRKAQLARWQANMRRGRNK